MVVLKSSFSGISVVKLFFYRNCLTANLLASNEYGQNQLYVFIMSYRSLEWIFTLRLPECRGTPCSKQTRYLKITSFAKWLSVCLRTKRLWVWVFWNYYSHGLLWYFSNIENLIHLTRFTLYVMRGAIWHHLYNLKNVKNTHGWVLL